MSALTATIKRTGEVIEFPRATPEQALDSLLIVQQYLEAYDKLKKSLQDVLAESVDSRGMFEHDGYMVRVMFTQRMNYDKAALRDYFDPDELDLLMEPAKGKIDAYIKLHLDDPGTDFAPLRESMVPVGRPYRTVRTERVA